jgi:glycosyltransferase involved in cell wall biosynthesis
VKLSILNSEWLRQKWIETGGSEEKSVVIPVPTWLPMTDFNMREELGIEDDVFVCGFHQRKHDDIFSPIQLAAYKLIENDKTHMVVLNGSDLYKEQAKELDIKHITFLEYLRTEEEMSKFFRSLELYTHGRKDGETYGTIFVEAMIHGVPCISHWSGIQDAMEETIGNGGYVVNSDPKEYAAMIQEYIDMFHCGNTSYFSKKVDAYREAESRFTYKVVVPKIEEAWRRVAGRD